MLTKGSVIKTKLLKIVKYSETYLRVQVDHLPRLKSLLSQCPSQTRRSAGEPGHPPVHHHQARAPLILPYQEKRGRRKRKLGGESLPPRVPVTRILICRDLGVPGDLCQDLPLALPRKTDRKTGLLGGNGEDRQNIQDLQRLFQDRRGTDLDPLHPMTIAATGPARDLDLATDFNLDGSRIHRVTGAGLGLQAPEPGQRGWDIGSPSTRQTRC